MVIFMSTKKTMMNRDLILKELGYTVLRFGNEELEEMEKVLERILKVVE